MTGLLPQPSKSRPRKPQPPPFSSSTQPQTLGISSCNKPTNREESSFWENLSFLKFGYCLGPEENPKPTVQSRHAWDLHSTLGLNNIEQISSGISHYTLHPTFAGRVSCGLKGQNKKTLLDSASNQSQIQPTSPPINQQAHQPATSARSPCFVKCQTRRRKKTKAQEQRCKGNRPVLDKIRSKNGMKRREK